MKARTIQQLWRSSRTYLLEQFIFSPLLIALILSVVVILFIPKSEPYILEQTDQWQVEKVGGISRYADLDNDGESEYLIEFTNRAGNKALKITTQKGMLIDQYNFDGNNIPKSWQAGTFTADFDNNGYQEVYTFYWRNDSIFVDYFSPLNPKGICRNSLFLDTIAGYNKERDFNVNLDGAHDFDKDGFQELIFSIHAGFSLQPRNLYLYNSVKQTLIKSPPTGVNLSPFFFFDINKDGKDELMGSTATIGNIAPDQPIPYRDSSSYAMVMTADLKFLFEPIEYPVYPSSTFCAPFTRQHDTLILALCFNRGKSEAASQLLLIDAEGQIVSSRNLTKTNEKKEGNLFFTQTGKLLLYFIGDTDRKIYRVDENLNLTLVKTFENFQSQYSFDLDSDGQLEYVASIGSNSKLTVFRGDLSSQVSASLPYIESHVFQMSLKENKGQTNQLFLQFGSVCLVYQYYKNPTYAYRFLVHVGVFLLMWLLMKLLQYLYKYQVVRQQKLMHELAQLQYKTISHQLDPHFILNAMNSVTASIMRQNKEDAYQLAAKFSKLFRDTLIANDKVSRTLEDELAFVENYLQLEQKRFNDNFTYQIGIDPSVDTTIEIPKMLIQNFVENAVKHGLSHLKKDGLLRINVQQQHKHLLISITDNGIGREKAKTLQTNGTEKGLKLMQQMTSLYKKLKGVSISFSITDLKDEKGEATGTQVRLKIETRQSQLL